MSDTVDVYSMLYALKKQITDDLPVHRAHRALDTVESMHGRATAYVWGREDQAGRKIREAYGRELIDASWEFGHMIAIMIAMYYLHGYPWSGGYNLRDCFAAFTAGRDLWDYVNSPWPS